MNTFNIIEGKLSLSFFFLVLLCQYGVNAVNVATCEGETAQLSCKRGYIKVISANYGRTDGSTCSSGRPAEEILNIQCTQNTTLNVLTSRCDGLKDCAVPVNKEVFGDPCNGTYKFLDVSYTCLPSGAIIRTMNACEGETIHLNCKHRYIRVNAAIFGRTDDVTCISGRPADQISNVQCALNSTLSVLNTLCDGKHTCSVPATNSVFGDPCHGTYKYLSVSYTCGPSVKLIHGDTCEGETAQLSCDSTSKVVTCESDIASLHCEKGQIKVISANYGRTDGSTCSSGRPAEEISNIQCTQNTTLNVLASRCDGQKDCTVSASNSVFGEPCNGTYKFLDVSYTCIPSDAVIQTINTCEGDHFNLNCTGNQIIKVISANYGRTDESMCSSERPIEETLNVQCIQSTTLNFLTTQCDGKQDCSVSVTNNVFGDPCFGTYKYLNVSYVCHQNHQFIKVYAANYGRTDDVTCISERPADEISNVQCSQSSTLNVINNECDGKQTCSVPATNAVFGDPCYGTYKYLNVSYSCGPNPTVNTFA